MAVDYRFTGTNIDATLVTDAPTGSKTFFVTELRGYDQADIMGGIDVGVQEYHEADFIQIGRDHNLQLDRHDTNGTFCLVVPAAAAGRFNGSTSLLTVPNVTLAASNVPAYPISIGLTWRMTGNDFAALSASCPPFYLVATDLTGQTRLDMHLSPGPRDPNGNYATVLICNFAIGGNRVADLAFRSDFGIQDMCVETEFRLLPMGSRIEAQLIVNGEIRDMTLFRAANFDMNDFNFAYGAQQTNGTGGISYQGIMRNLFVTANNVSLVNIVDPSNGTNTGSEADGTVTDITSVGVIV